MIIMVNIMATATASTPSASHTARQRLLKRIGRQWKPGDRLPTVRDLSNELKIGVGSVNLAVQELSREGLLVSRRRLGIFVAHQKALAGKAVTVVMNGSADGMVRIMGHAAAEELSRHGVRIDYASFDPTKPMPRFDGVDAVVMVNPNSTPPLEVAHGQRLLVLNTAASAAVSLGTVYDEVTVDQKHAAALAGQHLRAAGCTSACFLGVGPEKQPTVYTRTSQVRLESFERGWGEPLPRSHCFQRLSYGEGWGARMVADYVGLPRRPEAVFAASDELAVGFIKGALALGLEPGHDYQIVGFDGQQRGRDLYEGPLTTIAVPAELMGKRGGELLADRLLNPDQPTRILQLGCTLFKGNTVRFR